MSETTKPTADFWLARDEARVSWAELRRAVQEQRGKYAAWVRERDGGQQCERPCCAAANEAARTASRAA